jgi:hypothetical protein
VFQFVYGYGYGYGYGSVEGHCFARAAGVGTSPDDYYKHAVESVTGDPGASDVVMGSKDVMDARGGDTVAEILGRDFDYALDPLVAGIEAMAARDDGRPGRWPPGTMAARDGGRPGRRCPGRRCPGRRRPG